MANPLVELQREGQSVWYDNIRRGLISSGELKRLVEEDGIMGVTSNPAIFEKAIGGGSEYDAQIQTLLRDKPGEIFERLAVQDIRDAADVLRPIYDRTERLDGYISMEVWPELANDTAGSVDQAHKLWREIDRPNLMIKIPATPAGIPAIEQLISEGINVNVTLIFAVEMYRQVMEAYLKGLERCQSGLNGVRSVASFFVSRVDSAVDRQLEALGTDNRDAQALMGKAAIANAKLAYEAFKSTFTGSRWEALLGRGAAVQRPLWASTGTKNPNYSDVLYVEELIGRDTVNTMPPATVDAFKDHGEVEATLEQGLDQARRQLGQLKSLGIDMSKVTDDLLAEGVKLFADAFDTLMSVIEAKREALRDNIAGRCHADLGALEPAVNARLGALAKADTVRRMWKKDISLWGGDDEIKERLGWLTVTDKMLDCTADLERFASHVQAAGFKRALFCGSSGVLPMAELFRQCFGTAPGFLELSTLAAEQAGELRELADDTLVILVGKAATAGLVKKAFEHLWQLKPKGDHYVTATDAGTELAQLAETHHFRRAFLNAPDVAGNFGALSYLSLVAAAVTGVDVERMLSRAEHLVHNSVPLMQPADNAGAWFGAVLGEAALAGKKVAILSSPELSGFGQWAAVIARGGGVQAEVVTEPPAGDDRLLVRIQLGHGANGNSSAATPAVLFTLRDKFDLGEEIYRWQFATAVAGSITGANPFKGPTIPAR
ncbi:MAG: bifunctional transaldolase/phosoglucose isomerase [Chloroflexi bacterium]|nr:bifunctional transaldolase/phosoglucose isomerase [Chloroflexota bacterium]